MTYRIGVNVGGGLVEWLDFPTTESREQAMDEYGLVRQGASMGGGGPDVWYALPRDGHRCYGEVGTLDTWEVQARRDERDELPMLCASFQDMRSADSFARWLKSYWHLDVLVGQVDMESGEVKEVLGVTYAKE